MVQRVRAVTAAVMLAFTLVAAMLIGSAPINAQESSVSIVDFAFSSATITVEVGSTVTWSSDGGVTHTVTADGGEFDSGDVAPGETFSMTFDSVGTFGYFCEIHPVMVGAVVVVDSSDSEEAGTTTDTSDDSSSLPTTGTGPRAANQQANLFLLLLSVAAFAGATMFRRATRR